MKSGFPLHLKVTDLPSGMSESLISILAKASTSAAADMEDTNWVTTDLAAYAPATEPATKLHMFYQLTILLQTKNKLTNK